MFLAVSFRYGLVYKLLKKNSEILNQIKFYIISCALLLLLCCEGFTTEDVPSVQIVKKKNGIES